MLTPTQIKKLEPLTKHPRFGKLLIEAIKGWKHTTPRKGLFGIELGLKRYISSEKKCCLLGAALINKHRKDNFGVKFDIIKRFNITEPEIDSLIDGFDDRNLLIEDRKAFEFAAKVRKIVKP